MMKVFYGFAVLALLSLGISLGGKWFGRSIALAGHTDDATLREIVIGNNVISAPANTIRFDRQRRNGIASRLDLYLRWPRLDGYSDAARDDFNHANGARTIIFLSFEERIMSRDMSGRLDPIYASMLVRPGVEGPGGTTLYRFNEKSGYLNEVLAVAAEPAGTAFVARCLAGESADESLAPCERDIHVGDDLSLSYRFPRELLGDWARLDAAVRARAASMLGSGG
ncbi:hypothetical protein [Mesorhizobium sp. KR9-304]|uniref:hypothetical protein n=1 Tax=Mesorhizobium sp. KR9-304 TaxID=3156614 RepID=UPI0032B3322F